jgi:hypothetical protein
VVVGGDYELIFVRCQIRMNGIKKGVLGVDKMTRAILRDFYRKIILFEEVIKYEI